jgi:hypothetical protein
VAAVTRLITVSRRSSRATNRRSSNAGLALEGVNLEIVIGDHQAFDV